MHTSRQVVAGLKGLRRALQSDRRIAATPILIICGSADGDDTQKLPTHVHFMMAQQLGLRTVVSDSLGQSAFPTVDSVAQQQELASRIGAATVCAVGSEAAVHLGRAVVAENPQTDHLILVPNTYSGVMASGMERSLLIDTTEETLVPSAASTVSETIATPEHTIDRVAEASSAALAFVLSRRIQGIEHNTDIVNLLEKFKVATKENLDKEANEALLAALTLVGGEMRWGLGSSAEWRDITLAASASLLPKLFPESSPLEAMASLLPTLLREVETNKTSDGLVALGHELLEMQGEPLTLISNQSVDTLLNILRENQTAWKCLDAPNDLLQRCLKAHSLVD